MGRLTAGKQLMEIVADEGRYVRLRYKEHRAEELPVKVCQLLCRRLSCLLYSLCFCFHGHGQVK